MGFRYSLSMVKHPPAGMGETRPEGRKKKEEFSVVERKELYEHKGTGVRFTEEEYQMLVEAAKEPNPEYDDDVWESAMEKLHGEPAPDWLRSERDKHVGLDEVFFYSAAEPLRGAYTAEEILREEKYAPCYEMLDGQV